MSELLSQLLSDPRFATIIGAIIGFVATTIGTIIVFVVGTFNYRQKSDEIFFKVFDCLEAKRSLGISAIERYWNKRRYRDVCVSLLSGSAIYLLRESGQDNAAHELHNLDRIMSMLLNQNRIRSSQRLHYSNLRNAVVAAQKAAPNRTSNSRGLQVEMDSLNKWKDKLDTLLKKVLTQ